MTEAHKRTREQRRDFPKLYSGMAYAEVFALCLRGVWRDAHGGNLDLTQPKRRQQAIRGEALRIQMKTRMSAADYDRFSRLHQELGAI